MNVLQDFKERFLTFETVKGVYLLLIMYPKIWTTE